MEIRASRYYRTRRRSKAGYSCREHGPDQLRPTNPKGITEGVRIDNQFLYDWTIRTLPLEPEMLSLSYTPVTDEGRAEQIELSIPESEHAACPDFTAATFGWRISETRFFALMAGPKVSPGSMALISAGTGTRGRRRPCIFPALYCVKGRTSWFYLNCMAVPNLAKSSCQINRTLDKPRQWTKLCSILYRMGKKTNSPSRQGIQFIEYNMPGQKILLVGLFKQDT